CRLWNVVTQHSTPLASESGIRHAARDFLQSGPLAFTHNHSEWNSKRIPPIAGTHSKYPRRTRSRFEQPHTTLRRRQQRTLLDWRDPVLISAGCTPWALFLDRA